MRFLVVILTAVILVGCASYQPQDESPSTRAQLDWDIADCRTRAEANNYAAAGSIAGIFLGAVYGAIHGAAAGAGAGSSAEGALIGAAAGAGVGFILGLGASTTKYNETFDRCMESRGHRAT